MADMTSGTHKWEYMGNTEGLLSYDEVICKYLRYTKMVELEMGYNCN